MFDKQFKPGQKNQVSMRKVSGAREEVTNPTGPYAALLLIERNSCVVNAIHVYFGQRLFESNADFISCQAQKNNCRKDAPLYSRLANNVKVGNRNYKRKHLAEAK